MRHLSTLRLALAALATTVVLACVDNVSPTAPRTPSVSAKFSHQHEDGGKQAKVAVCKPQKEDTKSARIGPHGGNLTVGSNRLVIPAGALATEIEITAHALPSTSAAVELSPAGLQFAEPALLTMSYAKCETPLFGVTVAYVQADTVTELEPSRTDWIRGTVTAEIRHFSSYAVAY